VKGKKAGSGAVGAVHRINVSQGGVPKLPVPEAMVTEGGTRTELPLEVALASAGTYIPSFTRTSHCSGTCLPAKSTYSHFLTTCTT
jgi:hypothetical protein